MSVGESQPRALLPGEVELPEPPSVEERGGERWYWVAPVAQLPPGSRSIVEVEGREVGIFNVGGRFFAFRHHCPHLGGPLCIGRVLDLVVSSDGPGDIRLERDTPMLVCPWHGWEFDMETGQSYCDPGRWRARRYRVDVEPLPADDGRDGPHGGPDDRLPDGPPGGPRDGPPDGAPAARVPGPYRAEPYNVVVADAYVVVIVRTNRSAPAAARQ